MINAVADRRALRRRNIALVQSAPSTWLVQCDGCGIERKRGVLLLALSADVHLCRACLRRVRTVVTEALGDDDRGA